MWHQRNTTQQNTSQKIHGNFLHRSSLRKNQKLLESLKIYTLEETEARAEVMYENYISSMCCLEVFNWRFGRGCWWKGKRKMIVCLNLCIEYVDVFVYCSFTHWLLNFLNCSIPTLGTHHSRVQWTCLPYLVSHRLHASIVTMPSSPGVRSISPSKTQNCRMLLEYYINIKNKIPTFQG